MLITFGTTANFVISYDSTLTGAAGVPNGSAIAQTAMDYCEYDLQRLSRMFGGILPSPANLPISINIVPGAGGASNNEVNSINCFIPSTYAAYNQFGIAPTVVAELAEIFMVIQNKGWNPGWSNGEGLSRVSSEILYPPNAWLFSEGFQWYNPTNFPHLATTLDWVDNTDPSDQHSVSYGCAELFLNYLAYQLNYKWTDIFAAVSPPPNSTLTHTAGILGVSAPIYTNFLSLLSDFYPGALGFPFPSPTQTDDVFSLGDVSSVLALYMRHNLADTGTSHVLPISDSPDIILRNSQVAHPQSKYSTTASIANDNLGEHVLTGQANYVYLRVWNRGTEDAANVFATVYWSSSANLVTPDLWNLIGSAYFPAVPAGSVVEVSNPGIVWPANQIPVPGHYCFVAIVGNNKQPPPIPSSFATFADFKSYILANNNISWRNFNVVNPPPKPGPMAP